MILSGNEETLKSTQLQIVYEICVNSTDSPVICKSNEQIREFLKEKYIVTLTNQRTLKLNNETDFENPLRLQSIVKWYKIAPDLPFNYAEKVNVKKLENYNSVLDMQGFVTG